MTGSQATDEKMSISELIEDLRDKAEPFHPPCKVKHSGHVNMEKNQECQWYEQLTTTPAPPSLHRYDKEEKTNDETNKNLCIQNKGKRSSTMTGREITERNKTCQWYSYMTNIPTSPIVERRMMRKIKQRTVVEHSDGHRGKGEPETKQESNVEMPEVTGGEKREEEEEEEEEEKVEAEEELEKSTSEQKDVGGCELGTGEKKDNLEDKLQVILKQQQELHKQQLSMQHEIKQCGDKLSVVSSEDGRPQLIPAEIKNLMRVVKEGGLLLRDTKSTESMSEEAVERSSLPDDSAPKNWRLKGMFARNLAKRGEGTVGNLLWPGSSSNCQSNSQQESRPTLVGSDLSMARSVGRQRALNQESSVNMFEAFSQPRSDF